MTWSVKTSIPVEFEIIKVNDALNWDNLPLDRKIVIIDDNVYKFYSNKISSDIEILILSCEESKKDLTTTNKVLQFFQDLKIKRREPVIVIGGGVLLDLVGFCCSIYRRGIPYIRIPTTLLAIIDASVGAKTSINHFGFRNRLGSFYPPLLTLIDKKFIITQDYREISNGIAEILKLAIILDDKLFELIESNTRALITTKFQNKQADSIIDLAISDMINELNDNLWEKDLQRSVDFGHTFSPIIEMKNIPNLLHGEAVILDCLLSCCISNLRSYLSFDDLKRIFSLVKNCNLSTDHEDFYNADLLWNGLQDVINHRNGNQYLPLPTGVGSYKFINDLTKSELEAACKRMMEMQ